MTTSIANLEVLHCSVDLCEHPVPWFRWDLSGTFSDQFDCSGESLTSRILLLFRKFVHLLTKMIAFRILQFLSDPNVLLFNYKSLSDSHLYFFEFAEIFCNCLCFGRSLNIKSYLWIVSCKIAGLGSGLSQRRVSFCNRYLDLGRVSQIVRVVWLNFCFFAYFWKHFLYFNRRLL